MQALRGADSCGAFDTTQWLLITAYAAITPLEVCELLGDLQREAGEAGEELGEREMDEGAKPELRFRPGELLPAIALLDRRALPARGP